ncbi:MAG TPA: RelA/SpoT domain-containing protein [Verrucomicrobiae bacterium]|nr:RelA/SpoT domain-containing protein [Verrucomicrobiae bacterium]
MDTSLLTSEDKKRIAQAMKRFEKERPNIEHLAKLVHVQLAEYPKLKPLIHSVRWRVKEASHLKHKLIRKTLALAKPDKPPEVPITDENLLDRIEDLAGVRILHLHTNQFKSINKILLDALKEQNWLITGPEANTWDDEYRDFFIRMGVKTISRESLYTSVHYVLKTNAASPYKCELQVRTLAEEIWGEVSHTIDYPDPTESVACKEQLKVLARLSSSCIRLVDAIFESEKEFKGRK